MKNLSFDELAAIDAGKDNFATDAGQFLGGVSGWIRANVGLYLLLGPGIGGLAAINAGLAEAQR